MTLGEGFGALLPLARQSLEARDREILARKAEGQGLDPVLGSPCLSCLNHFEKLSPDLVALLRAGEGRRA